MIDPMYYLLLILLILLILRYAPRYHFGIYKSRFLFFSNLIRMTNLSIVGTNNPRYAILKCCLCSKTEIVLDLKKLEETTNIVMGYVSMVG